MKALLRSLATVALAAIAPLLVLGTPRGVGCDVAGFFEELKKCSEDEPYDASPPQPPICNELGKPNCHHAVTYVDADNHVVANRIVLSDGQGVVTVSRCKTIQSMRCVDP